MPDSGRRTVRAESPARACAWGSRPTGAPHPVRSYRAQPSTGWVVRGVPLEIAGQRADVGSAEPGGEVPSRCGRVVEVRTLGDVVERRRRKPRRILRKVVQRGVGEADERQTLLLQVLVDQRGDRGPERSRGRRSPNLLFLAIGEYVPAALPIRIGADIRRLSHAVRILVLDAGACLPRRRPPEDREPSVATPLFYRFSPCDLMEIPAVGTEEDIGPTHGGDTRHARVKVCSEIRVVAVRHAVV